MLSNTPGRVRGNASPRVPRADQRPERPRLSVGVLADGQRRLPRPAGRLADAAGDQRQGLGLFFFRRKGREDDRQKSEHRVKNDTVLYTFYRGRLFAGG